MHGIKIHFQTKNFKIKPFKQIHTHEITKYYSIMWFHGWSAWPRIQIMNTRMHESANSRLFQNRTPHLFKTARTAVISSRRRALNFLISSRSASLSLTEERRIWNVSNENSKTVWKNLKNCLKLLKKKLIKKLKTV